MVIQNLCCYFVLINFIKPTEHMKKQSTKQLMQDLQAAIKELKSVHQDRSKLIEKLQNETQHTIIDSQSK